jgi:hypothetical protein
VAAQNFSGEKGLEKYRAENFSHHFDNCRNSFSVGQGIRSLGYFFIFAVNFRLNGGPAEEAGFIKRAISKINI